MSLVVFDIETIPDLTLGRKLYDLGDLSDADVEKALYFMQRQRSPQSKILPLIFHQVVAISLIFRSEKTFKIWSLGELEAKEPEILTRFFEGIDKYTPQLISWNGATFDLPVIHLRALKHNLSCPTYWDNGRIDSHFKWNNYLSRYHERHLDLMDVLSNYNARGFTPLDQVSQLLNLPGKMGIDGSQVSTLYQKGELLTIRNYCETDVLNTYLVYLHFEYLRGNYQETQLKGELEKVQDYLRISKKDHLEQYLKQWQITQEGYLL